MQKGTILNKVFDRLKAAIDVVEDLIPGGCAKSNTIGVVTSCPTNAGTGMRVINIIYFFINMIFIIIYNIGFCTYSFTRIMC